MAWCNMASEHVRSYDKSNLIICKGYETPFLLELEFYNENMVLSVESQKNPSIVLEPCGSGLDSCQLKEIVWHGNYCCVPKCHNSSGRQKERKLLGPPKLSFHCFPNDEDMVKKWIVKIKRDPGVDFNLNKNTKICSPQHHSITSMKASFSRAWCRFT